MDIFVYSDESGVFDKKHNTYYVFGGLIFVSESDRDRLSRIYLAAENNIRQSEGIPDHKEVKASRIQAKSKDKLYRTVKNIERFGAVVNQKKLMSALFERKKTKQRYLDWVYKLAVRRKLEDMISRNVIDPAKIESITFFVDEHSTATDGLYELRESLEKEFKSGMWNFEYMSFHKPLFPTIRSVNLHYCNSAKKTLVRSADIIANHIYLYAKKHSGKIPTENKLHIYYHP